MVAKPSDALTPRQQRFVEEYPIDLNGGAAYLRAGYTAKSPEVAQAGAARLLADAKVAHALAQRKAVIAAKAGVDAEWVLRNLVSVAERAMQAEPVLDREGNLTGEYTFDSRGANRALELIGKHIGFFPKEEKSDTNIIVAVKVDL